jgi:hypothetical protein
MDDGPGHRRKSRILTVWMPERIRALSIDNLCPHSVLARHSSIVLQAEPRISTHQGE